MNKVHTSYKMSRFLENIPLSEMNVSKTYGPQLFPCSNLNMQKHFLFLCHLDILEVIKNMKSVSILSTLDINKNSMTYFLCYKTTDTVLYMYILVCFVFTQPFPGPLGWGCRGVRLPQWVSYGPVSWGCRKHQLHLCRGVRLPNECHGYGTKQSDSKASVMLEPWWKWSTLSLPLLPGPLWSGMVEADRILSMGQIELFDIQTVCKQMTCVELIFLK